MIFFRFFCTVYFVIACATHPHNLEAAPEQQMTMQAVQVVQVGEACM